MALFTRPALTAAVLIASIPAAFADTGRPTDYVPTAQPAVIDRQADDALARYEMVVDGGVSRRLAALQSGVVRTDDVDSYAKYLMVIDGISRESATERSHARQQSIASAEQRRPARASR